MIGTLTNKFISSSLVEIETFINDSKDCIDIRNKNVNEERMTLINVMENLNKIEE